MKVMSKSNQQKPLRADVTHSESGAHSIVLSGKRKVLRLTWILALCLSIAGWVALGLFSDKTTWIDSNGFLHEPLFALIPISYFCLFIGVILFVFDAILKFRKNP